MSPNPRVDTSFTRVKDFLIDAEQGNVERPVHFVNMLDKDSSGIAVVVRDIALRRRPQEKWGEFRFESYLLLRGELPEDGEFSARRKPGEKYSAKKFPFRKMRSGGRFTILRVQAGLQDIPEILPGLRHHDCMVCGLGNDAPTLGCRASTCSGLCSSTRRSMPSGIEDPHAQGISPGRKREAPTRGASTLTKSVRA